MSTVIIPVTNDPWGSVTVKLDGTNYQFETHWNTRAGAWFMDILSEDGVVLRGGIKIVVGWPPLTAYRYGVVGMPPGAITAVDTSGQYIDPTLDDLGSRVVLLYGETT
jgi:hypothetical protein